MSLEKEVTVDTCIVTTRVEDVRRRDLDRLGNTDTCDHDKTNHEENSRVDEELIVGLFDIFHFFSSGVGLYGTMKRMKKRLIFFLEIVVLILALDQGTKLLMLQGSGGDIVPGMVRFTLFKNAGIAFSIPLPSWIIVPLVVILIIIGAKYLHRELNLKKPLALAALGLILGGALGNLIDRIRFGYVVDFISIWKFPVFNVADAAITIGIGILILWYGVLEKKAA